MKDKIRFPSNENFELEKQGVKNNIVLEIDLEDDRFIKLIHYYYVGWNDGEILLEISNKNNSESFEREITAITIQKNIMILTWKIKF